MKIEESETKPRNCIQQLVVLKKQLQGAKSSEQTGQILQLIDSQLAHLKLQQLHKIQVLFYDVLKPIAREITNCNIKEKYIVDLKQDILLKMFTIYCKTFVDMKNINALQIIKQLLTRQTLLFTKERSAAASPPKNQQQQLLEQKNKQEKKQIEFQWAAGRLDHTQFHKICCEVVLTNLYPMCSRFDQQKLATFRQFVKFLYFIQDYMKGKSIYLWANECAESYERISTSNNKQYIKEATKQILLSISQDLIRLFRNCDTILLVSKQNLMLCGPSLCFRFLSTQNTIENKIQAAKILNQFAQHFYYKRDLHISQSFFAIWMIKNGIWNILFTKTTQLALVQSSQYICKLVLNRGKLSDNQYKQYVNMIWEVKQQLRVAYTKYIDPLRLGFNPMHVILQGLTPIRPVQQYSQQFFYVLQNYSRYGGHTMMLKSLKLLVNIVKEHFNNFKDYYIKRKALDAVKFAFDKCVESIRDFSEKLDLNIEILSQFITSPSHATLSIARKLFQSQQKAYSYVLQKVARVFIEEKQLVEIIIALVGKQKIDYKEELIFFLKAVLDKYSKYTGTMTQLKIPENTLLEAAQYPQIFTQLVRFCSEQICQNLFLKFMEVCQSQQMNFNCIKQVFYRINCKDIKIVQGQYSKPNDYHINNDPNKLLCVKQLSVLLHNSPYTKTKQQCAQLIAHIFTSFTQQYLEAGLEKSKQFMQSITLEAQEIQKNLLSKQIDPNEIFGMLCLIQQMLNATETFGVGQLKSHDSLITTSMAHVKIWNNASYGDDVLKCFQKVLPSNMTLFQLLCQIGQAFKCGAHQIYLQEGNQPAISSKNNGQTLLNLNFHNREFNAFKTNTIRIKKQKLVIDGSLSPQFELVLKEMFMLFASNDKMGPPQIAKYIQGVTKSTCWASDGRISSLLQQYDSDKDGFLSLQDFKKFYFQNCDNMDKQQTVWNNLANLHYRKDLRKFDAPLQQLSKQLLFRYHLSNHKICYKLLFDLSNSTVQIIAEKAKLILVHLPTCKDLIEVYLQNLDFSGRNCFEISYILVSVRYLLLNEQKIQIDSEQSTTVKTQTIQIESDKLTSNEQIDQEKKISQQKQQSLDIQEEDSKIIEQHVQIAKNNIGSNYFQTFIQKKNDLKIYSLLVSLYEKQHLSEQQKSLEVISINILRSLTRVPNLISNFKQQQIKGICNFKKLNIPKSSFFFQIVKKCLNTGDFTVYESSLVLCLRINQIQQTWIEPAIFHQDISIRIITLNFLTIWSLNYNFPINFLAFKVNINKQLCQQWYKLMLISVQFDQKINLTLVKNQILAVLQTSFEQLGENNPYDPILNGNLNILKSILIKRPQIFDTKQTYTVVENLLGRTLNSNNRQIIYHIMSQLNGEATLNYLLKLIKTVQPTQQFQVKQNFVGIRNLGSTCYMNSIIQQFFMILPFRNLILSQEVDKNLNKSKVKDTEIVDDFFYQLQKMYSYLLGSKKKFFNPFQFCLSNKDYDGNPINTSVQEDAHEFLNKIFSQVQQHTKKNGNLEKLEKVFLGKTVCQIFCQQCSSKKAKIQDFYHLTVQVRQSSNLMESFKRFIAPQQIQDYFCQTCQKKSPKITKQTLIESCPQILIVNLQRITFDLNIFQKVKVHSKLQFPENLCLQELIHNDYPKDNSNYTLKGLVIHSGTSEGGHYYSLIKVDGNWFKFNDQTVTPFERSDLQREAFGGAASTDNWGDSSYSTNAYILFYQKVNKQKNNYNPLVKIKQEQSVLNFAFLEEIKAENQKFYGELQLHQQSYFQFVNQLYKQVRPSQILDSVNVGGYYDEWKSLPNIMYFEIFLEIYLQISKFIMSFSNLKYPTLVQIGTAIYQLFSILPQKTYQFCMFFDEKLWLNSLCAHNDSTVRQICKVVLNKCLFVYVNYYSLDLKNPTQQSSTQRMWQIIQFFFKASESDIIAKNIFKSNYFFEFWRINIDTIPQIKQFCLRNDYGGILLDLLMGNQSPYVQKGVKRQDFPYQSSIPLVQTFLKLIQRKKNCKGEVFLSNQNGIQYFQLSEKQLKILSSTNFYKRMMKFKYDNCMLSGLIYFMGYNDREFSMKITELFLIGLNKIQEVEDTNALLLNIKSFLSIKDEFQKSRVQWLLGIPQYQACKPLSYGLRSSNLSTYLVYVSSLYFLPNEQYKPALQVLHDKHFYYTSFVTSGILTLLELINAQGLILQHILSMPPPCYKYQTYLSWIKNYIYKLKNEDHYGLYMDKNIIADKMELLYCQIIQKVQNYQSDFPVQKKILGKNKKIVVLEGLETEFYNIKKWAHETYVLENKPLENGQNQSLPDQIFKASQNNSYAKLFIESSQENIEGQNIQIETQQTINTLFIETKKPLLLKFILPIFDYQIIIRKGQIYLSYPFFDKTLEQTIKIQILEDQHNFETEQQKIESKNVHQAAGGADNSSIKVTKIVDQGGEWQQVPNDLTNSFNNCLEVACPQCTYLNSNRAKCQLCETDLPTYF